MLQYFVFLGAAVHLCGTFAYLRNIIKGTTKPNRVSWGLWSVAPMIAVAAALSDGVRLAVLPVFMSGFGPLLIFCASFVNKKSYWKITKFDYLCGVFSILALVLWAITKEPLVAILFAILSDAFAAVPTVIKMWKHPETETSFVFGTSLLSALTTLFVISAWTFSEFAFPFYLIAMNTTFLFCLNRRKILHVFSNTASV